MTEAKFQAAVIKYLKECGMDVFKYPGLITAGVPDLLCNYNGVFVAFELKVGKYQPTALQIATMKKIRKNKGYAFVFRHSETWEQELEYLVMCINSTFSHAEMMVLNKAFPLPELPKDVIV